MTCNGCKQYSSLEGSAIHGYCKLTSKYVNGMSTDDCDKWEDDTVDMVNHPSHYETGRFECIDVMQEIYGIEAVKHFCQCNAFKYLYRCDKKNGAEDRQKAQWYLNKLAELEKAT